MQFRKHTAKTMHVCHLSQGFSLVCDRRGQPYILNRVGDSIKLTSPIKTPDWVEIVNAWQAQPDNDCLRARGDPRWLAACEASMLMRG